MSNSTEAYYAYQTRARGLLDAGALRGRFERMAAWYGHRLSGYLPADRSAAVLDVPCGYGNFLYFLRQRGYTGVRGVDLDPAQVELARLLDLPAEVGNAFEVLEDPARRYDLITSVDFLEHLDRDDAFRFVRLCFERLNPGGVLLVRTPAADGPFGAHDAWNDVTHRWAMTSIVLRTVMEMHGFERVKVLDERPQASGPLGVLRLGVFHLARAAASGLCMALSLDPPAVWSRSMWGVGYKPGLPAANGR
jgi:2-polyprenyl-3-methyl-5-hydroxy-6-metoxy-1,4-benzoquinol methylase